MNAAPISDLRSDFETYGKASGYLLARDLGLPVSGAVYPFYEENQLTSLRRVLSSNIVSCRPDAPMGMGNHLPRGRDLEIDEISRFLKEVRSACSEALLLVSQPPSIELTGDYIPRYKLSGGVMAIVDRGVGVTIEFVGPGFDVGDLTRGKDVHTSIRIPWKFTDEKPTDILRYIRWRVFGGRYDISDGEYRKSRKRRIGELNKKIGVQGIDLENEIPLITPRMSHKMFTDILDRNLGHLFHIGDRRLGTIFGVMMNLYDESPFVFEIWQPQRSTPKLRSK